MEANDSPRVTVAENLVCRILMSLMGSESVAELTVNLNFKSILISSITRTLHLHTYIPLYSKIARHTPLLSQHRPPAAKIFTYMLQAVYSFTKKNPRR
jgi:hypothetical protein